MSVFKEGENQFTTISKWTRRVSRFNNERECNMFLNGIHSDSIISITPLNDPSRNRVIYIVITEIAHEIK